MATRHAVDTSVRYDRLAELPEWRRIEATGTDPVPEHPELVRVESEAYLASPELEDAVNLAIALGRPLLLLGDPGSGKTRLAHAVRYYLGLPLEEAYVKSTTRGQDLLWVYDAVARLYDAQIRRRGPRPDVRDYVTLGPLGRAIARAQYGRRSVVLIDEIDKADLDFPNDLLREIDELRFSVTDVPGLGYAVPDDPALRPIVIITHNEEKALPDAFLRRCVFHYVTFPDDEDALDTILRLHAVRRADLRRYAVKTIKRLRELDLAKPPGLSELLDWVRYLAEADTPISGAAGLPHSGALIKQRGDQRKVEEGLHRR